MSTGQVIFYAFLTVAGVVIGGGLFVLVVLSQMGVIQ